MQPLDPYLLSLGLGIGFGLVYGALSYLTYRMALGRPQQVFMAVAFGGMVGRLFVATIAIALVLAFTSVMPSVFIASFFAIFAIALVLEITVLHRQQTRQPVQRT